MSIAEGGGDNEKVNCSFRSNHNARHSLRPDADERAHVQGTYVLAAGVSNDSRRVYPYGQQHR